MPNEKAAKAEAMYHDGMKLVDIARKLDVPPGTVRRWKSTYHWDGNSKKKQNERSDNKSERSDKNSERSDKIKVCNVAKEICSVAHINAHKRERKDPLHNPLPYFTICSTKTNKN